MVRRIAFVSLWALATFVATGIGLAAVRSVAGQVVDAPNSELLGLDTTLAQDAPETGASGFPDTTQLPPLVVGDAEGFAATSTTEVPLLPSPVATEAPPEPAPPLRSVGTGTTATPPGSGGGSGSSATTESPPSTAGEETYHLAGGWVRLAFTAGAVSIDGAGPGSGFTMMISSSGPDRVNIAFRSGSHLSRLRAEWRGGELQVDVLEETASR